MKASHNLIFLDLLSGNSTGLSMIILVLILLSCLFLFLFIKEKQKFARLNTFRKSYEEIQQTDLLYTLIDNLPDFIYIKDRDNKFIIANKKLAVTFGLKSGKELIGKTDHDFYPKQLADKFLKDEIDIMISGKPIIGKKETGLDAFGKEIYVSTTKVPVTDNNGNISGLVGIGRIITEIVIKEEELLKRNEELKGLNALLKERNEEILQQQEELKVISDIVSEERNLLLTLINSMPDRIYIKDRESRFIIGNKMIAKIMGAESPDQLKGKTDFDFYPKEIAEDFYKDEQRIMLSGEDLINKEEQRVDGNGNLKITSVTKVPIKNEYGVITGVVGINRDITRQKEIENKLLQQKTEIEIQRDELKKLNDTKNKFFSIISHDLRNPYNSILGFSGLILEKPNDITPDKQIQYIELIQKSATYGSHLLENLLRWAQTQTGNISFNPELIDINEIIKANCHLESYTIIKKDIDLQIPEEDKEIITFADRNMADSIMRNLLTNALKFTPVGGMISILDETRDKDFVTISVSDSGVGIPEKDLPKLLNLGEFYTTQGTSEERGTGLGLIIINEFIQKHGGKLTIESNVGKGSKFSFTLPAREYNPDRSSIS